MPELIPEGHCPGIIGQSLFGGVLACGALACEEAAAAIVLVILVEVLYAADFAGTGIVSVIDGAIDYQATADTGTQRHADR